jgi:hypothetical protein
MKIEVVYECKDCKGTGLYRGMAERGKVAVVCRSCDGTGRCVHRFEYTEFTGRKESIGVYHVVEANPGICISDELEGIGGMDYVSWIARNPFPPKSEMRGYTCPKWWCQCCSSAPDLDWNCGMIGRTFSSCDSFGDKAECWARFDEETNQSG